MKIWTTPKFLDDGVQEMELIAEPKGDFLQAADGWNYRNWFKEGDTWHRTRDAAVARARELRQLRIEKAATEAARLAALPPIN